MPAKPAEANGVLDVAALYLSRLIVPSTSEKILRGLIEEDMRQRNICQYDIDATVCFLAGAMESEKYLVRTHLHARPSRVIGVPDTSTVYHDCVIGSNSRCFCVGPP